MLPYLYTLLYRANQHGDTVVRSLFMNFQEDRTTWSIDDQMMWGKGLLISPALHQGQTTVTAYFPGVDSTRWYNYYDGAELVAGHRTLASPLNLINLHLRGGEIIPVQKPDMTTIDSRTNGLGN